MGFVSHHQKFAVWFCSLTLSVHFSVEMCFTMAARVSSMAKSVCCILQDGKDLVLGANVSQSRAIEELQKPSQPQPFHRMADHLLRIAGIPPSFPPLGSSCCWHHTNSGSIIHDPVLAHSSYMHLQFGDDIRSIFSPLLTVVHRRIL